MQYKLRPAWRKQWFLTGVAVLLLFLPFLPQIDSFGTPTEIDLNFNLAIIEIPFFLACLVILVRHFAWRYSVENATIESRHGIIAREIRSIRVADLRNINVKQSIFQRLIGIGDVEFSSSGTAGVEVVFYGVHNPMVVMHEVQKMVG